MTSEQFVFLAMGQHFHNTADTWRRSAVVADYMTLESAAPSGLRLKSRILGIGWDSLRLAVRAVRQHGRRQRYLCANPWTAVALRFLGVRTFAVIGLYAVPGTRSWSMLRRMIRQNTVFTLVDTEAEAWNREGGNARLVRYGNTFRYPARTGSISDGVTIFVGGSSDRDPELLQRLIDEVKVGPRLVRLHIADGTGPATWKGDRATITWFPRVQNARFGELLSNADVVVLPLRSSVRAAGHMVTVGALECGIRVLATDSPGMNGYIDGHFVNALETKRTILNQALGLADNADRVMVATRQHWAALFSLPAFVRQIEDHLNGISSQA